jgi:hypothetical protein
MRPKEKPKRQRLLRRPLAPVFFAAKQKYVRIRRRNYNLAFAKRIINPHSPMLSKRKRPLTRLF